MKTINTSNYGQTAAAKPQRSMVVDLVAGATLAGITNLLTPAAKESSSETNRNIGRSLAMAS